MLLVEISFKIIFLIIFFLAGGGIPFIKGDTTL